MTDPLLLDASCILTVVREFRGEAARILRRGSTLSLAYYEIGNAIWRECHLVRGITKDEAGKVLRSIFAVVRSMDVICLEDEELGVKILNSASELGITYYDAAYLTIAQKLNRTLVTDDEELIKAAKKTDVATLKSRSLQHPS